MTTHTVRHALSPYRRAGTGVRAAARDTSTAARHALLGLRIATTAPARWAVACALAVAHTASAARGTVARSAHRAADATRAASRRASRRLLAAGRSAGRGTGAGARETVRKAGAAARGAGRAAQGTGAGLSGGLRATGRTLARAGRGFGGAARRGRRRLPVWWPVAVCTLLGALGGTAYGLLKAPEYTATSYVMVTSDDGGGPATVGYAQAYGRIATGGAVLNRARTTTIPLDALESGVEAVTSPDAPMIQITGTSATPQRAADMANRVAQSLTGIANLSSKDTGAELRVFSQALTPDTPASPSLPLSVAVGACTGGLLGALLLLVRPRRGSRGGLETVPAPAAAPAQDGPKKKKETPAPAKKNAKEKV